MQNVQLLTPCSTPPVTASYRLNTPVKPLFILVKFSDNKVGDLSLEFRGQRFTKGNRTYRVYFKFKFLLVTFPNKTRAFKYEILKPHPYSISNIRADKILS